MAKIDLNLSFAHGAENFFLVKASYHCPLGWQQVESIMQEEKNKINAA